MELLNNTNRKLKEKAQLESIVKKKQEIQYQLIGKLTPKRGHSLYEIDIEKLEIRLAEFVNNKTISWFTALKIAKGEVKEDILVKHKCVYISALNPKNAMKRFAENKGNGGIKEGTFKFVSY